jgi:MFS family permease
LFIINGLSFSAILVPMLMMDTADLKVSTPAARGGQPVRDALRFLRRSPRLFVLYIVFTIVGTFAFNYGVSLLKLADERFGDKNLFGWLLTVTSIGNVIGSLYTASRERLSMRFFFASSLLLGCTGFAVAWAPNVWVAFIVSIPLGAGGAAMIASLNGISQMESPPEMRGRLLALGAVAFLGTTPIGAPVTGWVADHVSAEWSLAYGSAITLLCTTVGIAAYRRSLARDVPAGQHHSGAAVLDDRQGGSVVVEH